jgi:hypothetical protein
MQALDFRAHRVSAEIRKFCFKHRTHLTSNSRDYDHRVAPGATCCPSRVLLGGDAIDHELPLQHWRLTGRGEAFCADVVSYADDFVILKSRTCGFASSALSECCYSAACILAPGPAMNLVGKPDAGHRHVRF